MSVEHMETSIANKPKTALELAEKYALLLEQEQRLEDIENALAAVMFGGGE